MRLTGTPPASLISRMPSHEVSRSHGCLLVELWGGHYSLPSRHCPPPPSIYLHLSESRVHGNSVAINCFCQLNGSKTNDHLFALFWLDVGSVMGMLDACVWNYYFYQLTSNLFAKTEQLWTSVFRCDKLSIVFKSRSVYQELITNT